MKRVLQSRSSFGFAKGALPVLRRLTSIMIAALHAVGVCVNALPNPVNAAKPERFSFEDQ